MTKEEIIKMLKEQLTINVSDEIEYGPVRRITVQLELDGEVISEESFDLKPDGM